MLLPVVDLYSCAQKVKYDSGVFAAIEAESYTAGPDGKENSVRRGIPPIPELGSFTLSSTVSMSQKSRMRHKEMESIQQVCTCIPGADGATQQNITLHAQDRSGDRERRTRTNPAS